VFRNVHTFASELLSKQMSSGAKMLKVRIAKRLLED